MTAILAHHGVAAVFVLMAIDAVLPAASELVMLYGGALASGALSPELQVVGTRTSGVGAFLAVAIAGTVGYLLGALAGWAIGYYGGRPFLERRGRWFHLDQRRLERAERWFQRWQDWAVLVGRITPLVRSFVSIPAGVFDARLGRYTALTALGSAVWCFAWAGAGWGLGAGWQGLHHDFTYVGYAVACGFIVSAAYVVRRRRSSNVDQQSPDAPH
jgi:membrane protein DedA with SNARE-associated domain